MILEPLKLEHIRSIGLATLELQAETCRLFEDETDGFGVPPTKGATKIVRWFALACSRVGGIEAACGIRIQIRSKNRKRVLTARAFKAVSGATVLLGLDASAWHLEETVGTIVGRDIHCHTAVASDLIAFITKVERVEWVECIAGGGRICGEPGRWCGQGRSIALAGG